MSRTLRILGAKNKVSSSGCAVTIRRFFDLWSAAGNNLGSSAIAYPRVTWRTTQTVKTIVRNRMNLPKSQTMLMPWRCSNYGNKSRKDTKNTSTSTSTSTPACRMRMARILRRNNLTHVSTAKAKGVQSRWGILSCWRSKVYGVRKYLCGAVWFGSRDNPSAFVGWLRPPSRHSLYLWHGEQKICRWVSHGQALGSELLKMSKNFRDWKKYLVLGVVSHSGGEMTYLLTVLPAGCSKLGTHAG